MVRRHLVNLTWSIIAKYELQWLYSFVLILISQKQSDGFTMTHVRFLLQLQGLVQVGLSRRCAAQYGVLLQSAFCLQPNLIKNAQRQVRQVCMFGFFVCFAVFKSQLFILPIALLGD